ncbi:hypothetical protein BEL04_20620 [Mucilaginibacter sp. PPCGB 2223]|uniref:hypothetical protein n=1 Tax=Mucilaginibacter sp. PPCGB 2223 TaxID=1886027 RepID=UPI0008246EB5|nr:hypothetical protein [Mucilaginibacter sp. PPCGB 2223]OCX51118.1 hypothetical protein BEL04_20620 [Mucilaginibacter sp. PPCGB 2223]
MKRYCIIILAAFTFIGCKDGIDDQSKRNDENCWWVDAKTGKGRWIPIGDHRTVKSGRYTLFYRNGKIFETGKLVEGKNVDTIFNYDKNGHLLEYVLLQQDTTNYYILTDGPKVYFYQNGGKKAEGIAKNHQIGDKWRTYYKNGRISWPKIIIME